MCGIFGRCSRSDTSSNEEIRKSLCAAQEKLHHRGPDDKGIEVFQVAYDSTSDMSCAHLWLGQTRLSIIDRSPGGHQPMRSQDGRYTIVFNGEIYNYKELRIDLEALGYKFRTNSDTEVLLTAWSRGGRACLRDLVGMFAFAVYDEKDRTLTLARDAFGIKPLFYMADDNNILFASELPALQELSSSAWSLNLQRAYDYLVFGRYDDQAATFYKGVWQLQPGHLIRFDLQSMQKTGPEQWWYPSIEQSCELSFEDAATKLREIFLKSVRLHLRSDVSLGTALSGGVDSSAIVCAMRYLQPDMPIHTFTYTAPGTSIDEECWADIVNRYVDAKPHKINAEPGEMVVDLEDMIEAQGEPFSSTSIYAQYRIFRIARESGIIVTLDGQGADELLAGYQGYPLAYMRSLFDRHHYHQIVQFLFNWLSWPGRSWKTIFIQFLQTLIPQRFHAAMYRLGGRSPRPRWLNIKYLRDNDVRLSPPSKIPDPNVLKGRRLVSALRDALLGDGLPALLRHGDRNSMRWSVESRVPFLTIEMAEFVLSLPESYLVGSDGETKRIFRAAMRGIVPDEILDRRDKIGFQTPEREWLDSPDLDWKELLCDSQLLPLFDEDEILRRASQGTAGFQGSSSQVWRLINFCRWSQSLYR